MSLVNDMIQCWGRVVDIESIMSSDYRGISVPKLEERREREGERAAFILAAPAKKFSNKLTCNESDTAGQPVSPHILVFLFDNESNLQKLW